MSAVADLWNQNVILLVGENRTSIISLLEFYFYIVCSCCMRLSRVELLARSMLDFLHLLFLFIESEL